MSKFPWMAGMVAIWTNEEDLILGRKNPAMLSGRVVHVRDGWLEIAEACWSEGGYEGNLTLRFEDATPDYDDPAMVGCLMHELRQKRGDTTHTRPFEGGWVVIDLHNRTLVPHLMPTEVEAILEALKVP